MKAYDPEEQYSDEEVRRALHGIDNTRRMSFRYERLDRNNNYIEDIDYIESCTISQNIHADIKRTASLNMWDEGKLNFLQDRIKPYVRIEMPKDENYTEKLSSLAPAVWYKFDEDALLQGAPEFHDLDEGTDFDTWEEAFAITYEASGTYTFTGVVSREDKPTGQFGGSNRTALWLVYQNTTSSVIEIANRGVGLSSQGTTYSMYQTTFNLYFAEGLDDQPALVETKTTNNPSFLIAEPRRGYYYLEVYPTPIPESSVNYGEGQLTEFESVFTKTVGLEETGQYPAIGSGANLDLSGPALVETTGKSLKVTNGAPQYWQTVANLSIPIIDGISMNYWQQLTVAEQPFANTTTLHTDKGTITFSASRAFSADATYTITVDSNDPNNPVSYNGSVTLREDLLDTEPHMITFKVSHGEAVVYFDSGAIGSLTQNSVDAIEDASFLLKSPNAITKIEADFSTTSNTYYLDDYSLFSRALGYSDYQELFRIGRNSRVARRGYVEWPQGVFVLSSPSRVFEDGIHVTRSVEAYDQLLVLSEDTFEERYAVMDGTPYLDAIEAVMQSTVTENSLDLEDNVWVVQGNSEVINVSNSTISISSPAKGIPPATFGNEDPSFTNLSAGSTREFATGQHFSSEYTFNKVELNLYNQLGTGTDTVELFLVRTFDNQVVHSVQKTVAEGSLWVSLDLPGIAQAGEYDILMRNIIGDTAVSASFSDSDTNGYAILSGSANGAYDALYRVYPGTTYGDYYGSYEGSAQEVVSNGALISAKVNAGAQVNVLGFIGADTTTGLIGDPVFPRAEDYLVAYFEISAGTLRAKVEGTTDWTATYSATTHAYLRVRDDAGVLKFETSADGIAWTLRRSYTPSGLGSLAIPAFLAKESVDGTTAIFSNIVVDGAYRVKPATTSPELGGTLPTTKEWEPGTSKLTIINDLLGSANFESAFFDEDGVLILRPYESPTLRPSEYIYETNSESIISGNVDQTIDLFAVPNSWVIVYSDPESEPMVAKYTNDNPHSITSTVNRGRKIVDVRSETEAPASQSALDAKVMRLAEEASQIYEHITFTTALNPIHQNGDVYNLVIDGLVVDDKFSEQNWSMVLEPGGEMQHEVRRSVEI